MAVIRSRSCVPRMLAAPSGRCMPSSCQAPFAASAAPSTSARSDMRYSLLAVALIGAATLGGCTDGVLDPKGPIALAERQILLNALGIMLAIVIPVILATIGVAFWFRASNERARYRPNFAYSGRLERQLPGDPCVHACQFRADVFGRDEQLLCAAAR